MASQPSSPRQQTPQTTRNLLQRPPHTPQTPTRTSRPSRTAISVSVPSSPLLPSVTIRRPHNRMSQAQPPTTPLRDAAPPSSPLLNKNLFANRRYSTPVGLASPLATVAPPPASTDVVDEFAGLDFAAILSSFLKPKSSDTPDTDVCAHAPSPELQEAIRTAIDLLERVSTAYRQRTSALVSTHSLLASTRTELAVTADDLATEKIRTASLRTQLESLAEVERVRAADQSARITALEAALRREEVERAIMEGGETPTRPKRSSGSSSSFDSGFDSESECDRMSVFSSTTAATTVDGGDRVSIMGDREEGVGAGVVKLAPPPPAMKQLVERAGVWGFFKGRTNRQQRSGGGGAWELDAVRMENKFLKTRVLEMESALDEALEAVAGRFQGADIVVRRARGDGKRDSVQQQQQVEEVMEKEDAEIEKEVLREIQGVEAMTALDGMRRVVDLKEIEIVQIEGVEDVIEAEAMPVVEAVAS